MSLIPESYSSLQDEIESRTNELKSRIADLAQVNIALSCVSLQLIFIYVYISQEVLDPEEIAKFKKRRELFSTFYTDPDEFLEVTKTL